MIAGRGPVALFATALGLGLGLAGLGLAQSNPNERVVKPQPNVQDSDDITRPDSRVWVLDFKFKDPRLIKVNIPGRGQKICWYMWYQITNNTPLPRAFIPDFELKTHDTNMVYNDEILPAVQEAIREVEDPRDFLRIRNSVTVAADPIAPSRKDAVPRSVTGVAIWLDPNEPNPGDDEKTRKEKEKRPKLADSTTFSIFVAGLSNGWAVTDAVGQEDKKVVRRKTLQLNFRRVGDRALMRSEDVQFVPPAQWIYRGSSLDLPALGGAKEK